MEVKIDIPRRLPNNQGLPMRYAHLSLITFALAVVGCGGSDMFRGSDANMRRWFQWGTEIELPAEAKYLSGRDYSAWGSAVRMRIHVPPGFRSVLDQSLTRDDSTQSDLVPTNEVRADQPEWSSENIARLICYKHRTGNSDRGGFITSLGLDKESGVLYCVILEYAS